AFLELGERGARIDRTVRGGHAR
ncbi:MAG: hypothetical protein QOD66_1219, partial [Solirubrobacteraceae bacterium]|nr:hypothetical protein [Solirubrobacteraceae bacterium]